MSKGVTFYSFKHLGPPFSSVDANVYGQSRLGFYEVVAYMHDYYSVSAEEQRRMAENTIALCELLYSQEVANV